MNDASDTNRERDSSGDEDDLQFDRAEPIEPPADEDARQPEDAAARCAGCQEELSTSYYEVNGQTICPTCRESITAALNAGSPMSRMMRAIVLGVIAAALCALLWGAIRRLTGYELGLIAIVVGLVVGGAVRAGSGGRGGRRYQVLAVVLTYLSITSTYIPAIYAAFKQAAQEDAVAETAQLAQSQPGEAVESQPALAAGAASQPAQAGFDAAQEGSDDEPPRWLIRLIAYALILGVALAFPFLAMDIIWFIIIGIALWEAWKINHRVRIVINGPYRLGEGDAGGEAVEAGAYV